ncbi:hypothetical protein [Paraburkholderia sp. WSM4175]|uniref:hypothetical protein n=1 Tax=Paraburkholderia sp. WSM4175 TaxID=2991072 RepID=UPI003D21B055
MAKPFALRQIKRNNSNARKAFGVAVPAVEFVERYVEATGLTGSAKSPSCSTQTSVTSARSCMKKHHVSPWRRLDAYQKHIDVCRFVVKTGEANEHAYGTAKFTPMRSTTGVSAAAGRVGRAGDVRERGQRFRVRQFHDRIPLFHINSLSLAAR